MKKSSKKIYLFPIIMIGITVISGSIAMMTNVSADDLPSIDDNITITVDSACTMGQTVTSSHTAELNPGETNNTIGQSRIAAYCNDNEGYAIYAIGYTNSEYGNTNLVSTDGNHTIPTGTSGSNSYWNMKLTQGTATGPTSYLPTMVNEFTTNATIPNDYTKVAYRDSSTISQNQDPTETGSYFTTTYSAHIDTTQPAGIYNGQVQYVMVHPASAPAPKVPNIGQLTYMQDFVSLSEQEKATLIENTKVGVQYTLIDNRDNKTYYVSKLADGNIWMTQNLDLKLDSGKTYTPADTDIPSDWTPVRSTTTGTTWDTMVTGAKAPHSYDPGDRYWDGVLSTSYSFSNINDRTVTNPSDTSGGAHYHVGNYYNWTAAVAMNDSSNITAGDMNQSICPAGWRLPVLNYDGSYKNLMIKQGLSAGANGNVQNAPTYFVYGGIWNGSPNYVTIGAVGDYWSDVSYQGNGAYYFYFKSIGGINGQAGSGGSRQQGFSLRCIAR